MSITAQLTEQIIVVTYDDLPQQTVDIVKGAILDDIGIACFGYDQIDEPLSGYARTLGGVPESTVIGSGDKVSSGLAAGVNAQMSTDTDFDETGPGVHAFAPIAKTAIAVGERVGASGKDVITAASLAYEINGRFVRSIVTPPTFLVFPKEARRHLTLNAAICASKMLGLTAAQLNQTLGIAWLTYVPPPLDLTLGKIGGEYRFRISPNFWSCQYGVQSALLASTCDCGPLDILDKDAGDIYDLNGLLSSPTPFHSVNRELCLKPWIGSYGFMGAIELVINLVRNNKINPNDIEQITFKGGSIYANAPLAARDFQPESYWQASNSIPWSLANAILGYEPGSDWVAADTLNDPVRLNIAGKVRVTAGQEEDVNGIEIMAKGRTYSDQVAWDDFHGGPNRPMSLEEIEAKFVRLARPVVGSAHAINIMEMCRDLENLHDIRELTTYFTPIE